MTSYSSDFLRILSERGFIHQCSDPNGLDELARRGAAVGYIGFDCTAPSLHVGSLVQIMMLYWLQKTGNQAIALMGGGTTMVGDPSGRDESRKLLTIEQIALNKAGIRDVFSKFLDFSQGQRPALMPDNAEWLTKLNYIDMLRDVGRHFSINRMLTMDSVRLRLEREHELSFIEFNYMILQSYDFVELARRYGANLQLGGSDQWGNIVNGIDLGRRMGTPQLYALTTPLITMASGAKMGKTAAGAVWLNADLLSPYEYWQYWRNAEDADVGRFMKLFTDLPLADIERFGAMQGADINSAKVALANAATAMLHGQAAAREAEETAKAVFAGGGAGDALPTVEIPAAEIAGLRVAEALKRAGLVESNGEAKRHIKAGAVAVNNTVISDELAELLTGDIVDGAVKLSVGKKRHALLRAV